jgi:hypothetical protein
MMLLPALAPYGDAYPKHPSEAELEKIASQIMQAISQRRWDDPILRQYFSPGLISHWDDFPPTNTAEEFLNRCKDMYTECEYSVEQINNCCQIYDGGRKATQWFTSVVKNLPVEHQTLKYRETVVRLSWQKTAGKWLCVRNRHARGSGLSYL